MSLKMNYSVTAVVLSLSILGGGIAFIRTRSYNYVVIFTQKAQKR